MTIQQSYVNNVADSVIINKMDIFVTIIIIKEQHHHYYPPPGPVFRREMVVGMNACVYLLRVVTGGNLSW